MLQQARVLSVGPVVYDFLTGPITAERLEGITRIINNRFDDNTQQIFGAYKALLPMICDTSERGRVSRWAGTMRKTHGRTNAFWIIAAIYNAAVPDDKFGTSNVSEMFDEAIRDMVRAGTAKGILLLEQ